MLHTVTSALIKIIFGGTCSTWLGGDVFPKLNWSAPRDAAWISFDKTMKCKLVTDVLLLLKVDTGRLNALCKWFSDWWVWFYHYIFCFEPKLLSRLRFSSILSEEQRFRPPRFDATVFALRRRVRSWRESWPSLLGSATMEKRHHPQLG